MSPSQFQRVWHVDIFDDGIVVTESEYMLDIFDDGIVVTENEYMLDDAPNRHHLPFKYSKSLLPLLMSYC